GHEQYGAAVPVESRGVQEEQIVPQLLQLDRDVLLDAEDEVARAGDRERHFVPVDFESIGSAGADDRVLEGNGGGRVGDAKRAPVVRQQALDVGVGAVEANAAIEDLE